jgi:hypothetical protein
MPIRPLPGGTSTETVCPHQAPQPSTAPIRVLTCGGAPRGWTASHVGLPVKPGPLLRKVAGVHPESRLCGVAASPRPSDASPTARRLPPHGIPGDLLPAVPAVSRCRPPAPRSGRHPRAESAGRREDVTATGPERRALIQLRPDSAVQRPVPLSCRTMSSRRGALRRFWAWAAMVTTPRPGSVCGAGLAARFPRSAQGDQRQSGGDHQAGADRAAAVMRRPSRPDPVAWPSGGPAPLR